MNDDSGIVLLSISFTISLVSLIILINKKSPFIFLPIIGLVIISIVILIDLFSEKIVDSWVKRDMRKERLKRAIGRQAYNRRQRNMRIIIVITIGIMTMITFFYIFYSPFLNS